MKAAALLLCLAGAANANQFWDGNKLYSAMNGNQYENMQALGYVMGVVDADSMRTICSPMTVTLGQMYDIVKRQLDSRPEIRHFYADVIVITALARVWPCERKKSKSS